MPGPIGIIGSTSANALAAEADVIVAIGTRLQDFTTGSWTVFGQDAKFISINAARCDATKHRALAVVGDAREAVDGARRRPRRLEGRRRLDRTRRATVFAAVERAARRLPEAHQRAGADLCPGGGRGEPEGGHARLR